MCKYERMQTIPYILFDDNGVPVPPERVAAVLRRKRAASPRLYDDVFGTISTDPHRVLVNDQNAGNVAALLDGSFVCVC